jgi:hypothetical protein
MSLSGKGVGEKSKNGLRFAEERMTATPQEKIARLLAQGQLSDAIAARMLSVVTPLESTNAKPILLNLRHSARHVGLSEQCFRKLHRDGVFPAVKLGASKWFRVVDLETCIAKRVGREPAVADGQVPERAARDQRRATS